MPGQLRAFCPTCRKLVSDDLVYHEDKTVESIHEHPVIVLMELMNIQPMTPSPVFHLTTKAYFADASKLDAELIVSNLRRRFNIPLPPRALTFVVQEVLTILREVAVEEEMRQRAKLKKGKAKKPLKHADEEPLDIEFGKE